MSYTVKYHPEGWRSPITEPPSKDGEYIVALKDTEAITLSTGEVLDNSFVTVLRYEDDVKLWYDVNGGIFFNALIPSLMWGTYKLIAFQPIPTPPWEIFPKENTDA